jgi:hypothetical protein
MKTFTQRATAVRPRARVTERLREQLATAIASSNRGMGTGPVSVRVFATRGRRPHRGRRGGRSGPPAEATRAGDCRSPRGCADGQGGGLLDGRPHSCELPRRPVGYVIPFGALDRRGHHGSRRRPRADARRPASTAGAWRQRDARGDDRAEWHRSERALAFRLHWWLQPRNRFRACGSARDRCHSRSSVNVAVLRVDEPCHMPARSGGLSPCSPRVPAPIRIRRRRRYRW